MANDRVLRIPRSDSPDQFVLIQVTGPGKRDLDFQFVATEGENPYTGSIKTSQVKKLRAKNYRGSDEEWSSILSYVIGEDKDAITSKELTAELETVATVNSVDESDENHELTITLRRRIGSITQRLGSITLQQNDDQAIQLFEWTGNAVARANDMFAEVHSLNAKYRDAENTISQLNSQLEELIQAKKDHDDQLIAKFAQLLNEKKLKIRNQQRLLATAKVDPAKVAELGAANAAKNPRKAGASRKSKRKAQHAPTESESEDAFELMDIDEKNNNGDNQGTNIHDEPTASESSRASTPEVLPNEETASEEEDEVEEPQERPKESSPGSAKKSSDKTEGMPTNTKTPSSPPPRRELPFARKGANSKPEPKPAHNAADVDTETDDEL